MINKDLLTSIQDAVYLPAVLQGTQFKKYISENLIDILVKSEELPADSFDNHQVIDYERRGVIKFKPKKIAFPVPYSYKVFAEPYAELSYNLNEKQLNWDRRILFYNLAAPEEPSATWTLTWASDRFNAEKKSQEAINFEGFCERNANLELNLKFTKNVYYQEIKDTNEFLDKMSKLIKLSNKLSK